jgi:hypothetical protein
MRRTFLEISPNRVADKSNVLQLRVPKPADFDVPLLAEVIITLGVFLLVLRKAMLTSVEFQVVASLSAVEVEIVLTYLVLPTELICREASVAENPP